MLLYDYHTHSNYSQDGADSIGDMAAAAQLAGLSKLAVTDHYDICVPEDRNGDYDYTAIAEDIRSANAAHPGLKVLHGLEIGDPSYSRSESDEFMLGKAYDFVIASQHGLFETGDFYYIGFEDEKRCDELMCRYLDVVPNLVSWGDFDVLGHATYPTRYMAENGIFPDLRLYYDQYRIIFRKIAEAGKGIEVNTSGLRQRLGKTMPDLDVLKLYRECGGEIVTVGSDAHRASDVGKGVFEGLELLREAGFSYVTAFERRTPKFFKL